MFLQMLHQSSARSVNHALGLSGGPARVHDEEGMIERELLKRQNVSGRIFATQIDEFGVENLFLLAAQLNFAFSVNEGENDDLK